MATRNSGSSCGGLVLIIILVIAVILVYRAGLMPAPVTRFLDPIAKQLEPIGKQLEPIANQLESLVKSLPVPVTGHSPTPAAQP